jgi:hypothetical protein
VLIENIYLYKFNLNIKRLPDNSIIHNYLLTNNKSDKYIHVVTNSELLSNKENIVGEKELKTLFQSNDEFTIDVKLSKNIEPLISSDINFHLLTYINQYT